MNYLCKKNYGVFIGLMIVVLVMLSGFALARDLKPYSSTCNNIGPYDPPIPLGVSGGNINDKGSIYCCSGTLGCLVQDNQGTQYILSNNHVLANTNNGVPGEAIIHPGLADLQCNGAQGLEVATLTNAIPLRFGLFRTNYVDAAIAQVIPNEVKPDGYINCVGTISRTPAGARLGLSVQKSGRTTGQTVGTISAVNATIWVTYNKTCGMGTQYARFKWQFRIDGSGFSAGGDSGSLIVTNPGGGCPRPVGLLFAGGNNQTFANPIRLVLFAFHNYGLSIVGTCGASSADSQGVVTEEESGKLETLKAIQERHEDAVLRIKDVVGIGIGLAQDRKTHVFEIYVKKLTPELQKILPAQLENVKVNVIVTGEILAR
jgi:hypothetical protein